MSRAMTNRIDERRLRNEPSDLMLSLVSRHDFVAGALAVFKLLAYALTYG
jgi:hypothetical protein